ncbi:MAG: PIN domain-containing protein [Methanoregula sp.]|nr:MAG: PIN domain-containing protein [Methanoregula sp.]
MDTEKFIDLYWTSKDLSKIIDDFNKLRPYLVVTEQQIDEFIRNRDIQLERLIHQIKSYKFEETLGQNALIRKFPKFSKIRKLQEDIKELKKDLVEEFQRIHDNPNDDIIFQFFNELTVKDSHVIIIKRTENIIQKAHSRKLRGNPPTTKDKYSIGDEINWESLLSKIDDDLIIISSDTTYKNHQTFLRREFQTLKKGKSLDIYDEVSEALHVIKERPSLELKEFEKEKGQIKADQIIQNFQNLRHFVAASTGGFDSSNNITIDNLDNKFKNNIISILSPSTYDGYLYSKKNNIESNTDKPEK